jgi:phenylalanyl-tRNA synthetase beta chain
MFAGLQFVSVYAGKPIPEGHKSVAVRVTYRAADRTLTDEEVNAAHAEFVNKVCAELKATIRSA